MSHVESRAKLAGLVSSVCAKNNITKQDLAKIALMAMEYLEDFELSWSIVPARTAFMSYMPPYIIKLDCYEKADKKKAATLMLHLRYAIVKINFVENDVESTVISFVGDDE